MHAVQIKCSHVGLDEILPCVRNLLINKENRRGVTATVHVVVRSADYHYSSVPFPIKWSVLYRLLQIYRNKCGVPNQLGTDLNAI